MQTRSILLARHAVALSLPHQASTSATTTSRPVGPCRHPGRHYVALLPAGRRPERTSTTTPCSCCCWRPSRACACPLSSCGCRTTSKAAPPGSSLVLLGAAAHFGSAGTTGRAAVIAAFVSPDCAARAHAIGRGGYQRGSPLWSGTAADDTLEPPAEGYHAATVLASPSSKADGWGVATDPARLSIDSECEVVQTSSCFRHGGGSIPELFRRALDPVQLVRRPRYTREHATAIADNAARGPWSPRSRNAFSTWLPVYPVAPVRAMCISARAEPPAPDCQLRAGNVSRCGRSETLPRARLRAHRTVCRPQRAGAVRR